MSIPMADNFEIKGKKQNVERDSFATLNEMKEFNKNFLPDIFPVTCRETGKMYLYNVDNEEDPYTGKFREIGISGSVAEDISEIKDKIPPQASKENQLADKAFVNSSISTNTANFIDVFTSVEALLNYTGYVTNNDYAYVISKDDDGNNVYKRYKYNEKIKTWKFEYALNNSSFTSDQWAAIQSGITAALVSKLSAIEEGATNVTESTVTSWGFSKNTGTITGIKMNGESKGKSGEVDLGTVITEHQDISGKMNLDGSNVSSDNVDSILDKTEVLEDNLGDDTAFIRQKTDGTSKFGKSKLSVLWNWIKSKADSVYLGINGKAKTSGSADSATKASQDSNGNVITEYYATKTDVSGLHTIVDILNADYEKLSEEKKNDGTVYNITDLDPGIVGPVTDKVEPGNMSAVTSNAVTGALADKKNLKLNEVSYNNADLAIPSADGVEFFNVSYSATNAPLNTMSWVFKSTKRGTGLHQIAFSAENASVDYIYSRTGQTSDGTNWTFSSWVKLATTSDLVSTCEDITSQCSATNDYITINSVKAFKMGTMVTLTCNITSKGNKYGVVKIPQKYTPRSADFEDQWFPYVINGYKCTATINRASEFYIQFESTIPNGVTYRASFTYHI